MHKSATAVMIYEFILLPWIECIMRHLGYNPTLVFSLLFPLTLD